ncbi:hypothetical protein L3137_15575 [Bacillus sonorensis]|uniref:hypothetical protein n=1 Tax=Bacillus sonorensis TaxID=119858 RepID=UPI001F47771F|nr:hypothetical protein [Bacillus sonorensis]MCF7618677.1 hypothetical protein [Bacillus sonorensis]
MSCPGARINATMDYAGTHEGIIGGFPNFEQGLEEGQLVYGTHFITSEATEWRGNVQGDEIGNPDRKDVPTMFRAANRYALKQGYAAGIPTLHRRGDVNVYGIILFRPGTAEIRSIKVSDLTELIPGDEGSRFRAVFRYMRNNNMPYAAAFPNFEEGIEDDNHVYGVVFLKPEAVQTHIIQASVLNLPRYEESFCLTDEKTRRVKNEIQSHCLKLARGNESSVEVEELEIHGTHVKAKIKIKHKEVVEIGPIKKELYSLTTHVTLDTDVANPDYEDIKICVKNPVPLPGNEEICLNGEHIRRLIEILVVILV